MSIDHHGTSDRDPAVSVSGHCSAADGDGLSACMLIYVSTELEGGLAARSGES